MTAPRIPRIALASVAAAAAVGAGALLFRGGGPPGLPLPKPPPARSRRAPTEEVRPPLIAAPSASEAAPAAGPPPAAPPKVPAPARESANDLPTEAWAAVELRLAGELAGAKVSAAVRTAKPPRGSSLEERREFAVMVRDGRILLPELPRGRYVLEVAAEADGRVVRAKREFEIGDEPLALDPIRIVPHAGIRARAVDAGGRPIPQAIVVAVREDEAPEQARRLVPDAEGYVLYGDLDLDQYHRVVALGLPEALETTVRTPSRRGEAAEVELKAVDRLVPCRIRLVVPADVPEGEALAVREWPAPPRLHPGDREFWTELLPGRHVLKVAARAGILSGELAVPATGPAELTVHLARQP